MRKLTVRPAKCWGSLTEQYLSGTLFLKPASTRIPSPHSRRSHAAPLRALSGVHTPIVVIRESGLTIIVLELELEVKHDN